MFHFRLLTVQHHLYALNVRDSFLSFVPPAGRQRQTAQHQWIGVAVYPEGQATGLSEALPANLSDSYRLDAQAEET